MAEQQTLPFMEEKVMLADGVEFVLGMPIYSIKPNEDDGGYWICKQDTKLGKREKYRIGLDGHSVEINGGSFWTTWFYPTHVYGTVNGARQGHIEHIRGDIEEQLETIAKIEKDIAENKKFWDDEEDDDDD